MPPRISTICPTEAQVLKSLPTFQLGWNCSSLLLYMTPTVLHWVGGHILIEICQNWGPEKFCLRRTGGGGITSHILTWEGCSVRGGFQCAEVDPPLSQVALRRQP